MPTTTKPAGHPNLATALAAFQGEAPKVHKGKTARIPGRDGRSGYTYAYADLADVAEAAYPVLARHGLSFVAQPRNIEGFGLALVGVLRHESGETDEGVLPITGRDAQSIGSSLTYGRRYLLGCMTGIVTDEDDDGSRATAAGTDRPQAERHDQQHAQQGTRQQGPQQQAPRPPAGDTRPDTAVVRAHTIAATKATDLAALRETYDQACASGTIHATIPDPDVDAPDGECPRITLGEFITRRRADLQAAA